jgi:hypothetical protein
MRLHQETWVQEHRDWKILGRRKEVAHDDSKTKLAQDVYKLFPERSLLAKRIASPQASTSAEMWHALGNLEAHWLHDADFLYFQDHNLNLPAVDG